MPTKEERDMLEMEFYAKKNYLSYSALNRLMFSPGSFYNYYVLRQRPEKLDSYLVEGKVIHCLLLDQAIFDKEFIVSPSKVPEGNSRTIVDKIYNFHVANPDNEGKDLKDYEKEVLDLLISMNLHQSLKTDPQRMEKVLTEQNISYWEFLTQRGDKTIIDAETLDYCQTSTELLKNNEQISELLGIDKEQTDTFKVYNEMYLEMELPEFSFGLKGILDNVVVDAINKKIYINDVKTTGKSLSEFKDTVEFYHYWLQASIYVRLVLNFLKDYIDDSWVVKFNFIVLDKQQQVYPFEVSKSTMLSWMERSNEILKQAAYHYNNRDYTLPYMFANGKVHL